MLMWMLLVSTNEHISWLYPVMFSVTLASDQKISSLLGMLHGEYDAFLIL